MAEVHEQPAASAQEAEPLSPWQGGGGKAAAAALPVLPPVAVAGDDGGGTLPAEPLLGLSSDDDGSLAPAGAQAPALSAEEAERRKRRRKRWEREAEAKQRWDLQRRLVDISTDVEFLAREVERVRGEMEVPLPPLSELSEGERAQLEGWRRKRCSELLLNHCKKTLAHITTHKWSWPFNAPVDFRQYPDYALTVSRPMDFGTVKKRIDGGAYRHPDEFLADVRLVFDNARLYNKPGSDVHVMANTLQERFEERYAVSVTPRVLEEAAVWQHQTEEARRRHVEASARESGDALEQHCALLVKYIDEVQACVLDARSAAAALCKPVSREEKLALVAALTSMPQEQFELAVGLVMGHHPGLQPYDDFGFDLDALDALTLRQMQSFVRACEAVEAEARESGRAPLPITWPQLLLGSGLRPYRPSAAAAKRQKRQQASAAAAQQVKREQQPASPPQQPQPQEQKAAPGGEGQQKRPAAEAAVAAPPASTPTQKGAAAAVGVASPVPPARPSGDAPAAGSAVGPKPLAATAKRQGQVEGQGQGQKKTSASPAVASTPVAPPPVAKPAAASGPTAAQVAAVANAGPQQQHLLATMSSLLNQVQKTQQAAAQQAAAAAAAKASGKQQSK